MATVDELLAITRGLETQSLEPQREEEYLDLKETPVFGDYIADIIRAPVGGVSDAVEALLRLGAIPVDLALDTNFNRGIQTFFDKYAPDAETGIGEGVQTLAQYLVPYMGFVKAATLAPKIFGGLRVLKGGNFRQLSSLPTAGDKALELVKRAGYFGAVGGAFDAAVSRPGSQMTLGESFGLSEKTDLNQLEGRDRAVEEFKQRIKFGAEGAVIGGAIPLLPTAVTLGTKYGIKPVVQVATPIAGVTLRALDKAVINPLAKTIAGKGTKPLAAEIVKKGSRLLNLAYDKTGLPPVSKWKDFNPDTGSFTERILKKLDDYKQQLTVAGKLQFPEIKTYQEKLEAGANAEVKEVTRYSQRIDKTLYSIASKFKTNIYDVAQYKATKQGNLTNIMDRLTEEKNKIFDYLKASGKTNIEKALEQVHPSVRNEAKKLKEILRKSNSRYGNMLKENKVDSMKELTTMLLDQSDSFFKQRFAAFNNKNHVFDDTTGPIGSKALAAVKSIIKRNPEYKEQVTKTTSKELLSDVKSIIKRNPEYTEQVTKATRKELGDQVSDVKKYDEAFEKNTNALAEDILKNTNNARRAGGDQVSKVVKKYDEAFEKNTNTLAEDVLKNIRDAKRRAGADPDFYVKTIATALRTDEAKTVSLLKPGETFPDAIKRYLNQEKNAKFAAKDYENALIDTVMYQANQFYSKNYFDEVYKILRDKGALFNEFDQRVVGKNLAPINKKTNRLLEKDPKGLLSKSPLFEEGQETLFTYPEIANALSETKVAFDNFFSFPGYKSLMSLKAGAQVAKTIFSPMTQIRNVTTASFFPLMSGLIGGRTSLSDSWKLVAQDIFTGAKTDLEKLNKEITDMVRRGVIDQNIEVNEIRSIMNKAKDGNISFESFMNNPTVKKFVDVYQGGDNLWKVYSDKFYRSALKDAFGGPNATPDEVLANVKDWYRTVAKEDFVENSIFTGQAKTADEAIKDVSAYLVTNTIPTYSKVPLLVQAIRRLPVGNFVAFPAEILRTTSNVLLIGARELTSTNPYIRQMGARRIIGASATLGGIGKIVSETAKFVTGVDEEQMEAAKRSFVPTYEKNATLIPLSKADDDGKFKYFNFSYSNPYDSLVRPFNAILGAFAEGSLNKDTVDQKLLTALFYDPISKRPGALMEFFSPFITESIGTERVFDLILRKGQTRNGSKIWFQQDDLQTRIAKGIDHIMGGLEPGAFTQASRVWQGATGQFTDAGTARNTKDELLAMMSGIRVQEVKPLSSMPFILTSYTKDRQNIGNKFSREAYSASNTPEQKLAAWKDYMMEAYDSQQKMYNTLNDAQSLGVSKREIRKILEERLTKSDTRLLLRGKFKAPAYSEGRFETLIKRLETEDEAAADLFEDNIKVLKSIFDDVKRDLRDFDLEDGMGSLEELIDSILDPEVREVRTLPLRATDTSTGTTAQAPNLPTNISGNPVNTNVVSQNFGNKFNLTQSLNRDQKLNFLFNDRE